MHPMNDSSSDLQTLVQSAQSAFDAAATPADLENAKIATILQYSSKLLKF